MGNCLTSDKRVVKDTDSTFGLFIYLFIYFAKKLKHKVKNIIKLELRLWEAKTLSKVLLPKFQGNIRKIGWD